MPKERWPDHPEWRDALKARWVEGWGDRRQELVFIGSGMDESAIRWALDECLIGPETPSRFGLHDYRHLEDPFPQWRREAA